MVSKSIPARLFGWSLLFGTSVAMSQPPQSFYTVGHKMFQLYVIGNHGEHRPIPVHVWYPSHQHDGQTVVYTSALYGVPLIPGTYDALSWTVTAESAKEDLQIAPPKAGGTDHGFPVIVSSHGSVDLPIDYYITPVPLSHGNDARSLIAR